MRPLKRRGGLNQPNGRYLIAARATDYNRAMSPSDTTKRKMRTPAERAAAYQAKANRARAQAAKQARDQDLRARLLIADGVVDSIVKRGLHKGEAKDLEFLRWLLGDSATPEGWTVIETWWQGKGLPK